MYKVETLYGSSWEDAEWTLDDEPMRFNTPEEAEIAIDEFILETEEASVRGDLDAPHDKKDYRVAEVV